MFSHSCVTPSLGSVTDTLNYNWDCPYPNDFQSHVARIGERRGVHRVLVGKPERKRPLGRSSRRWEDNIKTYLQELGKGGMDWFYLARDRDRWLAVMNHRFP